MNENKNIPKNPELNKTSVMRRFFCGHVKWMETGNTIGNKLHEHKCVRCNKMIYRDRFNPPISYVS